MEQLWMYIFSSTGGFHPFDENKFVPQREFGESEAEHWNSKSSNLLEIEW